MPNNQAGLGNIARTVVSDHAKWRGKLYAGQNEARRLLPEERRLQACMCQRLHSSISIMQDQTTGKAYYRGLATCGSVWQCPVCRAKITARRKAEIEQAMKAWGGERSFMITFTFAHTREDKLKGLIKALSDGLQYMFGLHSWRGLRSEYGIEYQISAFEATYGLENGWHPHRHILFLTNKPVPEGDKEGLRAQISDLFENAMARQGIYVSDLFGVEITIGQGCAGYLTKWGVDSELTQGEAKKTSGYTPNQLLELSSQGEAWAGAVYREYAQTMKGRKQLTYSPGLRRAVKLGRYQTDDEISSGEDDTQSEPIRVFEISYIYWPVVPYYKSQAQLLAIVETEGLKQAQDYLEGLYNRYRTRQKSQGAQLDTS